MKKNILLSGSVILTIIMLNSCELLNEDTPAASVIDNIEGQWDVDETNSLKSTAERYIVYISPDSDDDTKVLISGFYHLGDNVEAVATVSGSTLTLSRQDLPGGYTIVSGTGTISSNYKQISWSYSIDDGSGEIDNATAVYTPSY